MSTARSAAILLAKELRLEFRSRELLSATIVFALVVVVLFSFAFDPTAAESRRYGPGLLWISFLFAGSLMLNPSFARERLERHDGRFTDGADFAFCDSRGEDARKFHFYVARGSCACPRFSVLYNVSLGGIAGQLVLVLMLGTIGITVTGTVFSAISSHARLRELLLPLLLLPILTPLLIAAVEATASLFVEQPELDRTWVALLAGFDTVFLTASWLLCDYLIEE